MALKGRIEDFGLTDVLQLIVRRAKSGVITLSNDAEEVTAAIENGAVVAVDTERPMESELASRLARAGMITAAQLGTVLRRRAESGEQMANILIAERCATPAIVRPFVTAHALDTLFEVFTWPKGQYAFEERSLDSTTRVMDPIPMEFLLINGIRAVEETESINRMIPSRSLSIARAKPLPEDEVQHAALIDDLHFEAANSGQIEPNERMVYELCNPGIVVRTVLDRAPLSRFHAMAALASLIQRGYVRLS